MAVTDEERHELHSWLEQQAGPRIAATLMKHLPPVGWMDVTTNTALDNTRGQLIAKMEVVEAKIGTVEANLRTEMAREISRLTRVLAVTLVGSLMFMTSLVLGVVRFAA